MADPVTIVFSAVALAVSIGSAAWNVATHRMTGQYPKVAVSAMQIITPGQAETMDVLQIEVSNHGRVPLTVTNWVITFPSDKHIVAFQAEYLSGYEKQVCSNQPETTVLPGARTTYLFPTTHIRSAASKESVDLDFAYIEVFFAAHKPIKSTESVRQLIHGKPGGAPQIDR